MECLGSYVITWGLLFTEYKPWSQSPCFKQCIGEYLDSRCLIPHPVSGGNVLDVAIIHILDGEATEPRIKDLDEDREESPDPGVWVCNSRSSSWVWQTWNYSGHGLCLLESREDLYFGANPLASDINSILRGWAWGIQTIWALLDILKCCGWSCSQSERSFSGSGARHQFFLRKQCCHCTLFCLYQWEDEQGISVPLWGDEMHDNTHMYRAQISSHIICLCHACTYGYPSTSISCPYPPCPYTYLFSLTSLYHLWHLSHGLLSPCSQFMLVPLYTHLTHLFHHTHDSISIIPPCIFHTHSHSHHLLCTRTPLLLAHRRSPKTQRNVSKPKVVLGISTEERPSQSR